MAHVLVAVPVVPHEAGCGAIDPLPWLPADFRALSDHTHRPPDSVHTHRRQAALNMLTLTAARGLAREGILMNSVDTGWVTPSTLPRLPLPPPSPSPEHPSLSLYQVTDMAPGGVGATAAAHETFIGPPLDDEVRTCHCRILKARRTGSHFTGVLWLCAVVVWCGAGRRGPRGGPDLRPRQQRRAGRPARLLLEGLP